MELSKGGAGERKGKPMITPLPVVQPPNEAANIAADDDLRWTMTKTVKDGRQTREKTFAFDLTLLQKGYATGFLLALKSTLLNRRNRVSLETVHTEHNHLRSALKKVQDSKVIDSFVEKIDLPFLAALETIKSEVTSSGLDYLKRLYRTNRSNGNLFASDLVPRDFPRLDPPNGEVGAAIKRILSQALSRATLANTLSAVENAYESGQIDIGHYSFAMLAFQLYFRPETYRQLRLMDLSFDTDPKSGKASWFLQVLPVKTQIDNPDRLAVKVTTDLGELLKLQQAHVVQTYGHLVAELDLGKLALFPARLLNADGKWRSPHAIAHYGMCRDNTSFSRAYLSPIEAFSRRTLTFNALRHTVGTQLALAGLSASSIAAVLRHANDATCQRYVDLFFQGVLDRISDALQPSFDEHFPAYRDLAERLISKHDSISPQKSIVSEDLETGRREVTAECGRETLCGYAPLACYECPKFRPCFDADHSINLELVNREITTFSGQGLAMQHEVQKYKHLRNAIRVVIGICESRLNSSSAGANE